MGALRRFGWVGALALASTSLCALPGGAEARSTSVSCPGDDLQAAIDAASTGDTIEVSGTCTGNFEVPGSGSAAKITLDGTGGATIDGNHSGTAITATGVDLTIRGLRIIHGGPSVFGGGVSMSSGTLHLRRSTILRNEACTGAGVYVVGSEAVIGVTSVNDNFAGHHAGACPFVTGGGVEIDQGSQLEMSRSTLEHNRARRGTGGAIDIFGSQARIIDTRIAHNRAGHSAGGVSDQYGSGLTMRRVKVASNLANTHSGGGMFVDGATAHVRRATFRRNRAGLAGGGLVVYSDVADGPHGVSGNSHLFMRDVHVAHNAAREGAGAILTYASNGAGVHAGRDGTIATLKVNRSEILNNSSVGGTGGGIWNVQDPGGEATTALIDTHVRENVARRGGGIANTISRPRTPLGGFARLFLTKGTSVAGNVAAVKGGGVFNGSGAEVHTRGSRIAANHPDDCFGC